MKGCEHLQRQILQDESQLIGDYEKCLINFCASCPPHLQKTRDDSGIKMKFKRRCQAKKCRNHDVSILKMYSCMHCVFLGCRAHAEVHFKEANHPVVCTLSHGALFCFLCDDYIFDEAMEGIRELVQHGRRPPPVIPNQVSLKEIATIIKPSITCLSSGSTIGLRGLVNLKNTCYMNCIIQVLAHTPILSDFFLSDCYDLYCAAIHSTKPCLMACMADVFRQFYNGEKTPILLSDLLGKMWLNAPHLASADQQDAHEFLTGILEAMNRHFVAKKLPCAIEEIFHGTVKSTIRCLHCNCQSVTKEPFMEISLEVFGDGAISLEDCLMRYTQVEELAHTVECGSCSMKRESSKQLEIVQVPLILCLHFKRFHNVNNKKWEHHVHFSTNINLLLYSSSRAEEGKGKTEINGKRSTRVNRLGSASTSKVSRNLDQNDGLGIVAPPTKKKTCFEYQIRSRSSHRLEIRNLKINDDFEYSLYAVVSHLGSSQGGHYITYFRNAQNIWLLGDDHVITKSSLKEVLGCQAYMLFYHRTKLPQRSKSCEESAL